MADRPTIKPDTSTSSELEVFPVPSRNESYMPVLSPRGHGSRVMRVAGLAVAMLASPATAIQDAWFMERRRRDVITAHWIRAASGRRISRSEALRIARRILERAERERREIADIEAAQGIMWGAEV